jgi:TolB-like protein/tRNA A-37 threonylcarbamoyl transferase component Bud32/Tfp pilus assembly protein PilF
MTDLVGKTILHYRIIEQVGQGGMGVVYKAEDTKLDRTVAIKFLPRHVAANEEERKRFVIEAKAAAALNHSNIATIHNIEEADSEIFIVMEYIQGKELKDIVSQIPPVPPLGKGGTASPPPLEKGDREGFIPVDDIIKYAAQIAEGLQAAHKKGIVHRDIKSSNIMITEDGKVKIMDFGLAKFRGSAQLTQIGTTIGTAAYMSPEQARGEEADQRSDTWSFGVVLYEMLTGQLPFKGDYEQAVLYSMMNEEPEPISKINSQVPNLLSQIVAKSLQKDISQRYQNMSEILADLKSIQSTSSSEIKMIGQRAYKNTTKLLWGVAILIIVILAISIPFVLNHGDSVSSSAEKAAPASLEKIAILPFSNLRPDPDTDYLGFALVDQIIGSLAYVKNVLVSPSSAVRKYVGQTIDIAAVGDELNVKYLLTGNYLKQGDMVRLNVELVNADNRELIWRDVVTEKYENSFRFQDIISEKIINGLEIQFSPNEKALASADIPSNSLAYDYYLRAVAYNNNEEGNQLAIRMLDKSLALDSSYAPAWYEKGVRTHRMASYSLGGQQFLDKAIRYYKKSLEIKPDYIGPFASLAVLYTEIDRKEEALEISRKVLAINPNNPDVHFLLSYIYRYVGMMEEAVKEAETAVKINPDPGYRSGGHVFLYTGEYEKALPYYALDKGSPFHYLNSAHIHLLMGEDAKALQFLDKVIELDPNTTNAYFAQSEKAYLNGDVDKAIEYLQLMESENLTDGEMWCGIALDYALYNKPQKAIETLGKAVELGWFNYPVIQKEKLFDPFRDNPEFQKVLAMAKERHEAFKKKFFPEKQ